MSEQVVENTGARKLSWYESSIPQQEVVEETPVIEETPIVPEVTPEVEPVVEQTTPVEEVVTEAPVVEETPTKKTIKPTDYLEANKEKLKEYFELSDLDVSKVSAEDAVRRKLKADHPYFTNEDIEDELKAKYGIGRKLIEIDEDNMTSEEISQAKRSNADTEEQIRIGQRELRKDSVEAYNYLKDLKEKVELPELEYELGESAKPEEILAKHYEEQAQQLEKAKQEYWIPTIKTSLSEIGSVSETVEYEVNGSKVALDISYELGDDDKADIENWLSNVQVSDEEASAYAKSDGTYDVKSFIKAKSKERLQKKLLNVLAKEVANKTLSEFVQTNLVNHVPTTTSRAPHEEDLSPSGYFTRLKKTKITN